VQRVRPQRRKNQIPDDILSNQQLNAAIALLPANYNFEIHKSVWKVQQAAEKGPITVALQMPEGLLMFACIISDIFKHFCGCTTIIMGDITYGACCVDDFTAEKLGAGFLIHYGHSCLVPINVTRIPTLYVFVEIQFEVTHLCEVIRKNFKVTDKLALMGTIQFTNMAYAVLELLSGEFTHMTISQAKPLSAGETLGCTAPLLPSDTTAVIFVADGRFHLEAVMIQNPAIPAYRYDPYAKVMTREGYDTEKMLAIRLTSIQLAKSCRVFGLILGTLGRQGSPGIFTRLQGILKSKGKVVIPFLMAEINPEKLKKISKIECWVQVACPRLSIDWSAGFSKPILTPYELEVAMESTEWRKVYPMDYYSADGGSWTNAKNKQAA
jgi:2-(3-amino-3-carboxypropyl)histidine synthase